MSHKRKIQRQNAPPKPRTDIVMPAYGQSKRMVEAVASIMTSDPLPDALVTIVDDATPFTVEHDEALQAVSKFPNVKVHRRKHNEGFVAACNYGVAQGQAPLIVLMNTDVVLTPECLASLLIPFEHPRVGVVGAKLLFPENGQDPRRPAGKVQHAGLAFGTNMSPFHIHSGWSADNVKVCTTKEMQAVTGALFATRRELWDDIKGFDPIYRRGSFEDIDYCIQARLRDYGVIYCAEAVAYHYANASVEQLPAGQHFPLAQNSRIFLLRFGGALIWDEWRFW